MLRLSDIESLARNHDEFLVPCGLTAMEGALLPSEFLAAWLPKIDPAWVGCIAIEAGQCLGSGGYKGSPDPVHGIEIGYGTAPAAEGRGVATAMASTLADYAFSQGLAQVFAQTLPDGGASQRVLEKCGFTFFGEVIDPEDGLVHRYVKRRG